MLLKKTTGWWDLVWHNQGSFSISLSFSWLCPPPYVKFILRLVLWRLQELWTSQLYRTQSKISSCDPLWGVRKLSQNPLTNFLSHLIDFRFYHMPKCKPIPVTGWMPMPQAWFLNQSLSMIMELSFRPIRGSCIKLSSILLNAFCKWKTKMTENVETQAQV